MAIRSRVILLAVILIALASLIPVAAQTTECTVGFVNGLLRMTGTCGAMPHHLQPPPEFTGTIDPTPDRNLRAKRNGKHRDKVDRRQLQKQLRRDREDTRRVNTQATSTAIAAATATAIARAQSTAQAQLTATARAHENPKKDSDNAAAAQGAAAQGAMAPTPTAKESHTSQHAKDRDQRDRRQERRAAKRERNDRPSEARAQEAPGIFYPTPIPQLSPEPLFVNH